MLEEEVSVSVVIPVFNTEAYLGACLDSVLAQRLTDIDVICVDDGSTDRSLEILEEYARRDPRVRLVPQRCDGKGPGTARNTALQAARGRYISFVDSDDMIHEGMLQRMYDTAVTHDADVVMCTIAKFSDRTKKERYAPCTFETLIPAELAQRTFSWVDIREVLFSLRFASCNKIYRRSFLQKRQIRFSEGIFFEDLVFSNQAILLAERIRFVRQPLYYNRKQRDGATTFEQGSRVFDAITAMEQLEEFLRSDPEFESLLARFEAFRFRKLYEYLYKNDSAHLPPFFERLKACASSPSLVDSPYLKKSELRKRELLEESDLLDFLALELWEAKTKIASLSRQYRRLARVLRPYTWAKGKLKGMLRRVRATVRPHDSAT